MFAAAATDITETSATLNGSGDPSGDEVSVFFDYGLTPAYGNSVAGIPPLISGNAVVQISLPVTGLIENTTYHFRVRGVGPGANTASGNDLTFTTAASVPVLLSVSGEISTDNCFNALDSIRVAGLPETFLVTPTGHVTMIAGLSIRFLPNSTVEPGGYLHGYITLTGEFCSSLPNPVVSNLQHIANETVSLPEHAPDNTVRISPNPTDGLFTIELTGSNQHIMLVEIFNMNGLKVLSQEQQGAALMSISAGVLNPGIYIIHVKSESRDHMLKLIRM